MILTRADGNMIMGEDWVWSSPVDTVTTPTVTSVGAVRVSGLDLIQDFNFPSPPVGWFWRVGLLNGPFHPINSTGQVTVNLAPLGVSRTPAAAFLYNIDGEVSIPIVIPLEYPDPIPNPPQVIGSIGDVGAEQSSSVTRNAATAISGTSLTWGLLVNGVVPTSGWSISSVGIITIPTTATYGPVTVRVTATNSAGSVFVEFSVRVFASSSGPVVNVTPPTFSGNSLTLGSVWTVRGDTWSGGTPPFTDQWSFYRNDVAIAPFGSSPSYTIQAADYGTTITAAKRRTDSLGSSVAVDAVGSAVVPSSSIVPQPSLAGLTNAMIDTSTNVLYQNLRYGETPWANGTSGPGINNDKRIHYPAFLAVASLTGMNNVIGGKTATQRLTEQLIDWANNDRIPTGDSGYRSQYDAGFVAAVAIARLIPSVWNGLTTTQRNRLTAGMKGCMVGSCWQMSLTGAFGGNFNQNRSIRGYSSGWYVNPNFIVGAKLIPYVVANFMGVSQATTFLNTFNRANFAAELLSLGGLSGMYNTFNGDWTVARNDALQGAASQAIGPGPTASQLESALVNWRVKARRSDPELDITQANEMVLGMLNVCFSKVIRVGPLGYRTNPNDPGVIDNTRSPPQLRGVITNQAAWANLPNAGQMGMWAELDTVNGGYNPDMRSSMSYSLKGFAPFMSLFMALVIQGAINRNFSGLSTALNNMNRGIRDLKYRTENGHLSYAKGGPPSTNNENHPENNASSLWALSSKYEMGDLILRSLGVTPQT